MDTGFTAQDDGLLVVMYAQCGELQRVIHEYKGVTSVDKLYCAWPPVTHAAHSLLWLATYRIIARSGKYGAIAPELIRAELSHMNEAAPVRDGVHPEEHAKLEAMLSDCRYWQPEKIDQYAAYGRKLWERHHALRIALVAAEAYETDSIQEKAKFLYDATGAAMPAQVRRAEFTAPGAPLPSTTFNRVGFGPDLGWLNSMLGGGMEAGDVMLFLAPTGGGKTTLGTQMVHSRAKMRQHAYYLSYEQPTDSGDIAIRFAVMYSGYGKERFEGTDLATGLDPEVDAAYKRSQTEYGNYVNCRRPGGMATPATWS